MKANLRGLGGIKHFFIAHGEKLVIALVAIVAGMMIVGAMGRDSLPPEREASKLNQEITLARQNMNDFTWDRMKAEFSTDVREWKPLDQKGATNIDSESYFGEHRNIAWDPHVVPPIVRRTDPVLLEPQSVEANGGSGLLAFVDPAVRRAKILEEQRKAAEAARKQQKAQEQMQDDQGRGNRGGREDDMMGIFDPEHPKRRPVVGMVRPAGVALQDYEEVRVSHWAVVLAKVPIKEQLKLYRDAFENARGYNPAADVPQVLGYFVERAEINAAAEDDELKWAPVHVYNGKGERLGSAVTTSTLFGNQSNATDNSTPTGVTAKWVSQMPEIVDSRYLDGGVLTFPLPPLVGRDWGREVTHSDVPLAIDAVPEETKQPEEKKKPENAEETDMFAGGAGVGGIGGMGGRESMMGPGGYGGAMGGRGGMMMEGGRGGYGGGMPGMAGGYGMGRGEDGGYGGGYSGGGRGGFDTNGEPLAPHWLLRFFDFSVEPGKKYKYRVRMALLDPNQSYGGRRVDLESLDSEVVARIKEEKKSRRKNATPYRLTEWSKPSRTVTIPLAGSVSVAGAKPAVTDQYDSEPRATLLVQSFGLDDKRNAIQAAKEKDFQRGNVANMTEDTEVLVDQGRAIDPYKGFKFETDITVADIRGGERITREASRPARVLLMGPAGQLFVQDEVSDSEVVETHRATFTKEAPGGAGGGYMDYGGGRGMPGGGYGGGRR